MLRSVFVSPSRAANTRSIAFRMVSTNASGLTPEESKKLPRREPRSDEAEIIAKVKELYTSKPSNSSYEFYTANAVFHDPVGYAEGLDLIKSQFNGLGKIFSHSTVDRLEVLETPPKLPNTTILIDQDVTYYRKPDAPLKTINSLVTLERDAAGKVTRHTEEWDHKRESSKEDGFFGTLSQYRKTLTAKMVGSFVSPDAGKI